MEKFLYIAPVIQSLKFEGTELLSKFANLEGTCLIISEMLMSLKGTWYSSNQSFNSDSP